MDSTIRARLKLTNPIHFLALGFGSGLSPIMPGTCGTVVALPLVYLLSLTSLSTYIVITLVVSVLGIWLCGRTAKDMQVHDHGAIVWDEVAGMLISMIAVPVNAWTLLLGFVFFRLFDIVKPWPISVLDKRLHGGLGIMLDDIVAGIFALACVHLLLVWLG